VTAPLLSAAQPPQQGFGPARPRAAATPLYDALVHEYRLALRCVPGDQGTDGQQAAASAAALFPQDFAVLPHARRGAGSVPRQASRHRGASGDSPSTARH
jgi:hypothetical protein